MATEYVETLDIEATPVTVANTGTSTSLYSFLVPGGTLDSNNRLRLQIQGIISFSSAIPSFTVDGRFGSSQAGLISLQPAVNSAFSNLAVEIESYISANNAPTSQYAHLLATTGLTFGNDQSLLLDYDTPVENSNGALTLEVFGRWSAASASNSFTMQHATLEKISFIADPEPPDLGEALGLIYTISKLNDLHYTIRDAVSFYAPLTYDLDFIGIPGTYSLFTRNSTSTATWRDGAAHSVGINEPRFEYSGSTVLGLAINTATETLQYAPANNLSDTTNHTLVWLENNVYKSTKRGNTVPFNASGVYTGNSGVHVCEVVQFNKILTTAEDNHVELSLTT